MTGLADLTTRDQISAEDSEPELPTPPERIPEWAFREAEEWRRLSEFDIEVRAEERTGREVEIRSVPLPSSVWGLHVSRGARVRIIANASLPGIWRRFALFHELHHLLFDSRGEAFWSQTFQPLTKFESEADMFAWAAIWPDWSGGEVWD